MDRRLAARAPLGAFTLCTLVWGSTWLAIKVGYDAIPALTGASLRFFIASVVLFAIGAIFRVRLPRGSTEWGLVVFVGLVLFALDYGLIYWGEQFIASGLTSVLFASMPFWTLVLASAYGVERLTARKLTGITLGLVGVVVLFADRLDLGEARLVPMLAILASAACAGAASVATKKHGTGLHPVTLNAPAMLVGAAALLALAVVTGEEVGLPSTQVGWGSVLYLALGGSVVTFMLYFWLLQKWDASRTSLVSLGTPVTALALGAVVLQEPLTSRLAGGAALVLVGIYVATGATRRRRNVA